MDLFGKTNIRIMNEDVKLSSAYYLILQIFNFIFFNELNVVNIAPDIITLDFFTLIFELYDFLF